MRPLRSSPKAFGSFLIVATSIFLVGCSPKYYIRHWILGGYFRRVAEVACDEFKKTGDSKASLGFAIKKVTAEDPDFAIKAIGDAKNQTALGGRTVRAIKRRCPDVAQKFFETFD